MGDLAGSEVDMLCQLQLSNNVGYNNNNQFDEIENIQENKID